MEDNKDMVTTTETVEQESVGSNNQAEEKKEKLYTRAELNKILNAEKDKLKTELLQEAETKRTEAEKLAKMDTEQKLNYEIEQLKKKLDEKDKNIHSLTLSDTAKNYATEKGVPLGYLTDINYAYETAETIKAKIDNFSELRKQDRATYLNEELKQKSPKAVDSKKEADDPFILGFKAYKNKK